MKIQQDVKVAVDAVVFGYHDKKLQILLIQQRFGATKNQWALPGGFVKDNENLDEAVSRELFEETGIQSDYLEQLYTFGEVHRDPRGRVITIAFLALINPNKFELKADTDACDAQWFEISEIPELAFDHQKIVQYGLNRLRSKINYQPIGFKLLDASFPFSDLENIYQTILDRKIDRRNFRKKIMSFDILNETGEFSNINSGRPAKLYRFNIDKYHELVEKGFHFEIKFA